VSGSSVYGMSTAEIKVVSRLEKICEALDIPVEVLVKVYCEGAEAPSELEDKLLKLESKIAEELGADKVELAFKIFCRAVSRELEAKRVEKREVERVVKVPVFVQGEQHYIDLVFSNGKVRLESDIEGLCREPTDLLIGWTTIYVKCGSEWQTLVHRLPPETVMRLRKMLRSEETP